MAAYPVHNSPIALYHGRDRQASGAQLLDDPARQGFDVIVSSAPSSRRDALRRARI
jgi:hypothetical protein